MKKAIYIVLGLLLLTSCFHKSLQNGEADDILKSIVYNFKDGKYLISVESIYQATSKKSGKGVTVTSGYIELRISSYDLETGKLLARVGTGKQIKHAIQLLGSSEGNIWFYSLDDGLHSRDPKTLDIKVTQDQIFGANPGLKENIDKCEWSKIGDYYTYSLPFDKLLISDKQGYRYLIDPLTLKAEKQSDNFEFPQSFQMEPFYCYSKFNELKIDLEGDLRKQITLANKPLDPNLTFLDGKFILDNNLSRLYKTVKEKFLYYKENYDRIIKEKETMKEKYGSDPWKFEYSLSNKYRKLEDSERYYKYPKDDYELMMNSIVKHNSIPSEHYLLMPDSTSFFLFHKTTTSKDANVIISRVQIKNHKEEKELWKLVLNDIFYDYHDADKTDSFKKVFSKGNPRFDYIFMDLIDNKIVMIYMLNALCIDINNGKLLWKFRM